MRSFYGVFIYLLYLLMYLLYLLMYLLCSLYVFIIYKQMNFDFYKVANVFAWFIINNYPIGTQ